MMDSNVALPYHTKMAEPANSIVIPMMVVILCLVIRLIIVLTLFVYSMILKAARAIPLIRPEFI